MTTTTLTTSTAAVPASIAGTTVLRRAVAAEWTRFWTVRSTWWSLLAATAMMLFVGIGFGLDVGAAAPVWVAGELGIVFAQFALFVPVMLAVTAEYSTGTIRSTLQAIPRRGALALARSIVSVGVATAAGVVLALAADVAAGIAMGPQAEVVVGDVAGSLAAIAVVVACGALMTVALASALRSSAGTLVTMFMLWLLLPALLPGFGVAWLATVGNHLPGTASIVLLDALGEPALSGVRVAVVLASWVGLAVGAGLWSLLRRDAA